MGASPVSSHLGGFNEQLGSFALGAAGFSDTATLTLVKVVTNTGGGTAVITDFTLTATGPSTISGAGGVAATQVGAGTYTLSETGPASYTGTWVCVGTSGTQFGTTLVIASGDSFVCTNTNVFQVACPTIYVAAQDDPAPPAAPAAPLTCEVPPTPNYTPLYNEYDEPSERTGS